LPAALDLSNSKRQPLHCESAAKLGERIGSNAMQLCDLRLAHRAQLLESRVTGREQRSSRGLGQFRRKVAILRVARLHFHRVPPD
jgi:hypothetical protein